MPLPNGLQYDGELRISPCNLDRGAIGRRAKATRYWRQTVNSNHCTNLTASTNFVLALLQTSNADPVHVPYGLLKQQCAARASGEQAGRKQQNGRDNCPAPHLAWISRRE